MDFIEDYRLIKCLREGTSTDMDVYDAAALSAVVELSCQSVARHGRPVECPDFTRGRWRARRRCPSCTCERAVLRDRSSRAAVFQRRIRRRERREPRALCSSRPLTAFTVSTGRARRLELVRPRPDRNLRQTYRLRRRPIADLRRPARLRDRRRSARRRPGAGGRRAARGPRDRRSWPRNRRRLAAGRRMSTSSRGGWRVIFRARRSARTSRSPATCRARPG